LLVENLINFSGGNAKKVSLTKLKPRYLCDDTFKFIESVFKWKLDKYSFHSLNIFWFHWVILELLALKFNIEKKIINFQPNYFTFLSRQIISQNPE
jgi:hypothetical protein